MCEVGRIVYRLVVDLDDHIPGTESGLFPAAAFFHRAHQHAFAVLDPKEVSQLRGKVFHHQPAAQRRGTMTTETGTSKSGIAGICGMSNLNSPPFGAQVIDLCRSASCTLIVRG